MLEKFSEVKKYLEENELDIQNGIAANLFADMAFCSFLQVYKRYGIDYSPQFSFIEGEQFTQLTPVSIQNTFSRYIYDLYLENPESFEDLMKEQDLTSKKIGGFYNDIKRELSADRFRSFIEAQMEWWVIGIIGEDKGRLAHEELLEIFKNKGLTKSDSEEKLSLLTHMNETSLLIRPKLLEAKIRKAIKKGKNVEELLKEYIDRYFFFETTLRDRKIITTDILREKFSKDSNEEELDKLESLSDRKEAEKELNLSPDELMRVSFLRRMVTWVDERRVIYMRHNYCLFDVLHKIATELKIPYENLIYYNTEEVVDLLKNGKHLDDEELASRKDGMFVIYQKDQKRKKIYGDEAKELLSISRRVDNESSVEGMVASRGHGKSVTGRVRIIRTESDSLLDENEILVTSMTRPEFVKYMKNAAAIVTDEGGVACHAAIVSREMGKVCVIGTKHATQTFKDGDLVEVNIGNGTVRKIND